MTKLQKTIIHVAAGQLGLNRAQYLMVLRNVADVESSNDLSNEQFEDVMAHFEGEGWIDRDHGQGYWSRKAETRSRYANERLVHRMEELVQQTPYRLGGLCMNFSRGRTDQPSKLNPQQAYRLIEMLKNAANRARTVAATSVNLDHLPPIDQDEPPF